MSNGVCAGILCVDMDESNRIVTGGVDAQVVVFDTAVGKTLAKLHGHQRKVNQVAADPKGSFVLSVSDDKTARYRARAGGFVVIP